MKIEKDLGSIIAISLTKDEIEEYGIEFKPSLSKLNSNHIPVGSVVTLGLTFLSFFIQSFAISQLIILFFSISASDLFGFL